MKLSEHLRPKGLSDLVQPRTVIEPLECMARERRLMNMLFYGKPGAGKTSGAHILMRQIDADDYVINGSLDAGIEDVRTRLVRWASSCSLFGGPKVCLIDECEKLSPNTQVALRGMIEEYDRVAFLMTANDISKLDPALKSRCMPVGFDIPAKHYPEVIARLRGRYRAVLEGLGIVVDGAKLERAIYLHFPDLRAIANRLEFYFGVQARHAPCSR